MISIWDSAIPLRRILPPELPKESGMPPPGPFFLLSGPIEPKRLLQAHKKDIGETMPGETVEEQESLSQQ